MDGRKIEIHLEQIPWSWKFDGKKMWSEDGAKRSRKDYFLVVKKLTIPVGFDRKCLGKCGAFWLYVVVTIQTGGPTHPSLRQMLDSGLRSLFRFAFCYLYLYFGFVSCYSCMLGFGGSFPEMLF